MPDFEQFAGRLRDARKKQGLSQAQVAEKLLVSTQAVSKWEQGKSAPDLLRLKELAKLLRVSADALLDVGSVGSDALIAVDGGGTKTEFVLLSPEGKLLRRLVLEGSNPNVVTVAGTCEILRRGVDTLLKADHRLLGMYIGGAGMGSGGNGEAVEAYLRSVYPDIPLQCRTDITNVLACADDPDNAVSVICGTGSVVYATRDGVLRRFGGGGWKLDPLGSGYGVGCMALSAVLEHRDGTGPATLLTDAVEQKLGGRVWENIGAIYDSPPAFAASFAPLVLDAWQQNDAVAARIVEKNCSRMAFLAEQAAAWSPNAVQVLMGGSLLTKGALFREKFTAMLPPQLKAQVLPCPQVWGACLQCARLLGIEKPDVTTFMKDYQGE